MNTFTLDTSGFVDFGPHARLPGAGVIQTTLRWSDLTPFEQGYVEALFANLAARVACEAIHETITLDGPQDWRFSDLSPEALALIRRDCDGFEHGKKYDGESFWRQRQAGNWTDFPPLTPYLSDDGKVHLREV